jgi:hypothetical protein
VTSFCILAIVIRPFDVDAPKYLKIIWLSNFLAFTVPDEGYFRNALCALSLISMFLFNSDVIFASIFFSHPNLYCFLPAFLNVSCKIIILIKVTSFCA